NLVIEVGVPARLEIHELIRRHTPQCLGGGCGHRSDDRYGDGAEEENRQPRADQADKYGGPEHRAPAGDGGAREASREQATLVAQPDGPRRARVTYASVTTGGRGIGAVRQENTRQPTNSRIAVHTMTLYPSPRRPIRLPNTSPPASPATLLIPTRARTHARIRGAHAAPGRPRT